MRISNLSTRSGYYITIIIDLYIHEKYKNINAEQEFYQKHPQYAEVMRKAEGGK